MLLDLPTIDELDQIILEAAQQIADYQAVRWSLAKLKPHTAPSKKHPHSVPRWPELDSKLTEASGELPNSLDYEACCKQAVTLIHDYRVNTESVTIDSFTNHANNFRVRFTQASFYANREFLIWFHGKDLLEQLFRNLRILPPTKGRLANISKKDYVEWAPDHLSQEQFADLAQLPDKLSPES